ncbi:MAG: T9SS type A sorting domain-containing protein, partial [Bacteroidales bacterium]|nr:T9SS type A sorting domain-containing protein [Bacteroidales bacterium]
EIDTALTLFNWGVSTIANGLPAIESITVDGNNNIYLGGRMEGSIFNSFGDETLPAAGGGDFMIAKVAVTNDSCGCAYAIPHAQLISFVNNVLTVSGNVNNNADSLVWYWGDGSSTVYTTPNTNIMHTYQNAGTYTIYLRAWNICGLMEDSLQNLTSGINTLNRNSFSMTYYPNPFTQTLTIEFNKVMKNGEIYLFDLVGKVVLHKELTGQQTTLNTSAIDNGIYVMKVVSGDGDLFVGKVVKNN